MTSTYSNRKRIALALRQPTGVWTNGFSWDSAGRLANVTSKAGSFDYTYTTLDPIFSGRLVQQLRLPSGAYITNTFDPVARVLATVLASSGAATLDAAAYGYNAGNQRTACTNASGAYVLYSYDGIGQLKVAANSVAAESRGYTYDAAWNLNYRTNVGGFETFLVDTKNQLTNAPAPDGTLTYDPNGNLTNSAEGKYLYVWDDENRLTQWFHLQNGLTNLVDGDRYALFRYDGMGRLRVRFEGVLTCTSPDDAQAAQRLPTLDSLTYESFPAPPEGCNWTQTSVTEYLYDGRRVIQERDSNNVPLVSYTRGLDLSGSLEGAGGIGGLLARSYGTSHACYHADGNGNITCLIDTNQTVVASYRYDPFGNTLSQSGGLADANVYRFSSKEIHPASGMYYYGYRFYDPSLQRWINRDPIQEQGGVNLYRFVVNRPTDFIDKFGLQVMPPPVVAPPIVAPPIICAIGIGYLCSCAIDAVSCVIWPEPYYPPMPRPKPKPQPKPLPSPHPYPIYPRPYCPHRANHEVHCTKQSDDRIEGVRICIFHCDDGNDEHYYGEDCDKTEYWKIDIIIP